MGNLAALLSHCARRGDEAIVGRQSHVYQYEAGGASVLGGVACNVVEEDASTGELPLRSLEEAVRRPFGKKKNRSENEDEEIDDQIGDPHSAPTRVVCLESTHNRCGGAVLSVEYLKEVRAWADDNGLKVHLDGARLFNAAVALEEERREREGEKREEQHQNNSIGSAVREITRHVDSVTFCLSKGLGAPVGSLLCGRRAFVARARRWRKMLGGGLRQVGVLAAPGLVALEGGDDDGDERSFENGKSIRARLRVDHENARTFARGVKSIPGLVVDGGGGGSGGAGVGGGEDGDEGCGGLPQSNIVVFGFDSDENEKKFTHDDIASALARRGVRVAGFRGRLRAVTSSEVAGAQVEEAVEKLRVVMRELGGEGGR